MKLENSATGAENIELPVENTLTNEWEELTFDFSSIPDDAQFQTLTIFVDLLIDATGEDVTSYFDDIVIGDGNCSVVGVFEPIEVASVKVTPNPAHSDLFLEVPQEVRQVVIFNALGQKVNSTIFSNGMNNLNVDVSNLQKGMYFISLMNNDGVLIGKAKFIKD
jgi:hypothetical protein